ncbi:hypothetical protein [Caproiciproducens sp.]|uniref:hypothetical protein n=1 Tax=Caproiciproducens sp. TaxID=1954376 RepID=UPI0028A18B84|nr:hypothetical protein [Caproiciproducens sp.]
MGMPIIVPGNATRCQAVSDIIASVALEQTALSHILNAEGEKLQTAVSGTDIASAQLLETEKSVGNMVDAISRLEIILQSKLALFGGCICIPGITNGSFENDFEGWTLQTPSGATSETVTNFDTYNPISGSYFALLKTDGAGNYNILGQEFSANIGDKISGWSFFYDAEGGSSVFNDNCSVVIKSNNSVIATPFSASSATTSTTPWTQWEYTFNTAGKFTVEASIANGGDPTVDSYMGMDAVQLIPIC